MRDTRVGLIANASASRDVRRITSLARTIDVHERVNTVARVLGGLAGAGVSTVLYMPERAHVVERAVDALAAAGFPLAAGDGPRLQAVHLPGGTEARDAAGTAAAAAAMAEAGAACIVTVGGDGTNRAVALGWPSAVVVALPGGTNNAFGTAIDPTAAGLAAGLYAADGAVLAAHVHPAARLDVVVDGHGQAGTSSIALVDVVLTRSAWVGAHALWDPALLVAAVVARSDPAVTGLAGLGGMLNPLPPDPIRALHVRFDPACPTVTVPLGPGQLVPVGVRDWRVVELGETVELADQAAAGASSGGHVDAPADEGMTVAFDGERELVLPRGSRVTVRLTADGPRVLDARAALWAAAEGGAFTDRGAGR
jgi:hypothetical protein